MRKLLKTEIDEDIIRAIRSLGEILEKFAYAGIAGAITMLAGWAVGVSDEHVREIGLLNAAVAFYSHEATRNVIKAMWKVARVVQTKPEGEEE